VLAVHIGGRADVPEDLVGRPTAGRGRRHQLRRGEATRDSFEARGGIGERVKDSRRLCVAIHNA